MPSDLTPPLKYPGGKHYLAKQIVALMPRHLHYVEPYCGDGFGSCRTSDNQKGNLQ